MYTLRLLPYTHTCERSDSYHAQPHIHTLTPAMHTHSCTRSDSHHVRTHVNAHSAREPRNNFLELKHARSCTHNMQNDLPQTKSSKIIVDMILKRCTADFPSKVFTFFWNDDFLVFLFFLLKTFSYSYVRFRDIVLKFASLR